MSLTSSRPTTSSSAAGTSSWFGVERNRRVLLQRILTPAAEDWSRGQGGLWHANPRLRLLRRVVESPDNWLNKTESGFVHRSVARRNTIRG